MNFEEVENKVFDGDSEAKDKSKDDDNLNNEEAKEEDEEECNDDKDKYGVVDDIEPISQSSYSKSSTTQDFTRLLS